MKIVIAFVVFVSCTVAANVLLKSAATAQGPEVDFLSRLASWPVVLALACLGSAMLLYFLILTWLPLNVAQSFAAVQFIAVIFAARIFLAEPISDLRWVGIALISAGIAIVGWSQ